MGASRPGKILAVASSGGHWAQLRRLAPSFAGHEVVYVTTDAGHWEEVAPARLYAVGDASRWNRWALLRSAARIGLIVLRERPRVVISTGAAPGYLAITFGALVGARTLWVDSIANVEELSLSGRMASRRADLCLTQWAHLAGDEIRFAGRVL